MHRFRIVGALAILVIVAGGVLWYWSAPPSPDAITFSADGNLTRNNPGQKPDVWFLIYEKPGSPGLSVELDLNSVVAPYISLTQGERVQVTGTLRGSVVIAQSITPVSVETGMIPITLYFYSPSLDQGPGGVQCSRNGLVAVERIIPKTAMPLTEAIKLLLRGEIPEEERARGIESEFPLPGVALTNATVNNGAATLTFVDPQNKTGGGSCRVAIYGHR
jgi:hypothetical protein